MSRRNEQLSKSIRTTITNIERSLGLEAEAPGDAPWEWGITLLRPRLELEADDRVLVLVPHPDDDILSAAGTIQQIVEMGLPIKVVYLTNGDYNETSYALYRKEVSISQVDVWSPGRHQGIWH